MSRAASPNRSKCSTCPVDGCSAENTADDPPLAGWRFALASSGLFLGPLVLMLIGAVWAAETPAAQLCGALAGLGAGVALSVAISGILRRVSKDNP